MNTNATTADVIVVGGGLVGSAISYGLARNGAATTLLDEGDNAFRASRGNFGLVWVQGKGSGLTEYASWTRSSANLWPEFAIALLGKTDTDVGYAKPGGLKFCMSERELEERASLLNSMRLNTTGGYDFQMLGRQDVRQMVPAVGDAVVGASYCPHDGHVSPLLLLRALHQAILSDVDYQPGSEVAAIERKDDRFYVHTPRGTMVAPRVVLAAGLGNAKLAPMVGLRAPVRPVRGQILVTERVRPFLDMPTHYVRQTEAGTVMMGDSHEDVGFNVCTTASASQDIATRALAQFPVLADVQVIRTWGALRVMTPDGYPIYEQSETHPGAFIATCHSGVTLAAAHAMRLAPAIVRGELPPELARFRSNRFEVNHGLQAR